MEDILDHPEGDILTVAVAEVAAVDLARFPAEEEVAVHKGWNVTDSDIVGTMDVSHSKVVVALMAVVGSLFVQEFAEVVVDRTRLVEVAEKEVPAEAVLGAFAAVVAGLASDRVVVGLQEEVDSFPGSRDIAVQDPVDLDLAYHNILQVHQAVGRVLAGSFAVVVASAETALDLVLVAVTM